MAKQQIIGLISSCPTLTEAFHKQISIHCSSLTNPPVMLGEKQCCFLSGKLSFNQKRGGKNQIKYFCLRFCETGSYRYFAPAHRPRTLSHTILCFPKLTFHPQVGFGHNFTFLIAVLLSVLCFSCSHFAFSHQKPSLNYFLSVEFSSFSTSE